MTNKIPSTPELRELLQSIKQPDIELMSKQSGVPVATIIKIRHGVTTNPGLETARRIYSSGVVKGRVTGSDNKSKKTIVAFEARAKNLAKEV